MERTTKFISGEGNLIDENVVWTSGCYTFLHEINFYMGLLRVLKIERNLHGKITRVDMLKKYEITSV